MTAVAQERGGAPTGAIGAHLDDGGWQLFGPMSPEVGGAELKKAPTREAWIAEYSFFTKDGVRKQAIKHFPTKKAAKEFRDKTGVDVREGKHVPERASINIREAAEIWFKVVKSGRNGRPPAEASTLRQYRTHIDHHILPELGSVKLSQLTASRVSTFRDHLLARVSRPLAKKVLTSLKSIVGEAQSRDLVAANAASSVKIQTTNGGRHKTSVEIPEASEIKAVLAVLDERAAKSKTWRRWRAFMATAIHTGLRASELRGLPWGRDGVDLKAGTLTVTQRADENGKIGSPKSLAGHRTVNLPPSLVTLLREWKAECPRGALVLPNWQGNVESLGNIHNRCWKPLQRAALEKRSKAEDARWEKQRKKLEAALRRARD